MAMKTNTTSFANDITERSPTRVVEFESHDTGMMATVTPHRPSSSSSTSRIDFDDRDDDDDDDDVATTKTPTGSNTSTTAARVGGDGKVGDVHPVGEGLDLSPVDRYYESEVEMRTPETLESEAMIVLPSLEETASVSSSDTQATQKHSNATQKNVARLAQRRSLSSSASAGDALANDGSHGNGAASAAAAATATATSEKEIERLKSLATKMASRGKEQEAIRIYHRALKLMKADSAHIKRGLQQKPSERSASLHQEWMHLASTLAEIRTVMAVLYERMGEYNKALDSCQEANQMYKSYAHLVQKHGISDTDIEQYQEQMTVMIGRLEVARGSFLDRKNHHERALAARKKIRTARTSTEREKLYGDVFRSLGRALEMERDSLGDTHPQVADTMRLFGALHFDLGQYDEAIHELEGAASILRLSLGPYHPRTGMATKALAKVHETRKRDASDIDAALSFYEESVACFREAHGTGHALVGATLNNIAVIHIQRNETETAILKLTDALASYEDVDMAARLRLPGVNGIGGAAAAPAAEGTLPGGPPFPNAEAAQVWKNLGECHIRRREWERAHFAFASALEIQREARRSLTAAADDASYSSSSSSSPRAAAAAASQTARLLKTRGCDDVTLADTMLRLGRATKETGRHDESSDIYREALSIYKVQYRNARKASNERMTPTVLDFQDRLAHSLYCIAESQEILGHYEDAVKLYTESLNLRLSSDAERAENRMNMVHCAMALAGIGSVHMRKRECADARLVFKESITFLAAHGVPDDHEIVRAIQKRLAEAEEGLTNNSSFDSGDSYDEASHSKDQDRTVDMDRKAQALMEADDFNGALETLTAVLAIRRRRLTRKQRKLRGASAATATTASSSSSSSSSHPHSKEKDAVARTLGNFATVLSRKGERRQAAMLYRESIQLYKSNGTDKSDPLIQDLETEMKHLQDAALEFGKIEC